MKVTNKFNWAPLITLLALASTTACSDDTTDPPTNDGAGGADTSASPGGASSGGTAGAPSSGGGASSAGPAFAIGSLVTGVTESNAYLRVEDDLAFDGAELSLDDAREFAGQSDFSVHGGKLYVASGDAPEITRYEVADDLTLTEEETVNFTSYGLSSAAFWNNRFVSDDKAYMLNGAGEIVVWNPTTMELVKTITIESPGVRSGLKVVPGLADRSSVVHAGKFYLPLYWTDDAYADKSDDSVVVVVDVATDTVTGTIAVPCPGLDYGTVDDDGKLHFSNWTGSAGTYFVLDTAATCVGTIDPATEEVTTKTFSDITGGHQGAAFKYAGDGKFVMSVFDEVKADAANAGDAFAIVGGPVWRLWSYDPTTGNAAPVEGVDWNSGAIIHAWAGSTLYSMVPGADYSTTQVYELGAGAASADKAFGISGWSFRLFQLR